MKVLVGARYKKNSNNIVDAIIFDTLSLVYQYGANSNISYSSQNTVIDNCQTWPACLVVVTPGGAGDYRDTIAAPHRARYWEIRENQIVITRRLQLVLLLHLSLARIGSIKRRLSARDTQDVLLITAE